MQPINPTALSSKTTTPFLSPASLPSDIPLDNPFWQFSLGIWKNTHCQTVLLDLQNKEHWAINQLLFACWCGLKKCNTKHLSASALIQAQQWQQDWVSPLRNQRQNLRNQSWQKQLKQALQQVELFAEQVEQGLLFIAYDTKPNTLMSVNSSLNCILINLLNYIEKTETQRPLCTTTLAKLRVLIKTCIPTHEDSRIDRHLAQLNDAIEQLRSQI